MLSILRCISGNELTCPAILLSLGYTPSLMPPKKCRILRTVSVAVLSLPSESVSMDDPALSSGSRNGAASMYPVVGKLSSNIIISLISSVRASLVPITPLSVENSSFSTLSAA